MFALNDAALSNTKLMHISYTRHVPLADVMVVLCIILEQFGHTLNVERIQSRCPPVWSVVVRDCRIMQARFDGTRQCYADVSGCIPWL